MARVIDCRRSLRSREIVYRRGEFVDVGSRDFEFLGFRAERKDECAESDDHRRDLADADRSRKHVLL